MKNFKTYSAGKTIYNRIRSPDIHLRLNIILIEYIFQYRIKRSNNINHHNTLNKLNINSRHLQELKNTQIFNKLIKLLSTNYISYLINMSEKIEVKNLNLINDISKENKQLMIVPNGSSATSF